MSGRYGLENLGHGWGYEKTPAEQEKSKEFYDIYWKEYRAVKHGENSGLAELPWRIRRSLI